MNRTILKIFLGLSVASCGVGQVQPVSESVSAATTRSASSTAPKTPLASPSDYVLGPGDQLSVFVTDLEEFDDKTFRVDGRGDLNLPLAGHMHAAGLTVDGLEHQVALQLTRFIKSPDVVIKISEFRSQPVSILGAVGNPGVRQIEGGKTLFEVLSLAGGLRPDAGNTINVTRDLKWGAIPLAGAKPDTAGRFSVASVSVKTILNATDPEQNITIMPGDVISISKAEVVYAVGYVMKPGAFPVGQNERLSALQVLSLAEGLQKTASPEHTMILRVVPGSTERQQIAVNIKQLMTGKAGDVSLQPDDILFVPNSKSKTITMRSIDAVIGVASGMAVYGRY